MHPVLNKIAFFKFSLTPKNRMYMMASLVFAQKGNLRKWHFYAECGHHSSKTKIEQTSKNSKIVFIQ